MTHQHFVKVVNDNALATDGGWAMAHTPDTGDIYLLIEQSAASREDVLTDAWTAANRLQRNIDLERSIREGYEDER